MRFKYVTFFLFVIVFSCKPEKKSNCDDLVEIDGKWFLNNKPFTGNCEKIEDEKLKMYSEFKDGLPNGKAIRYYPNGKKKEIVEWEKGIANGEVKYFYENGVLADEGFIIENSKEGEWKGYYSDGKLSRVENWQHNKMNDSAFSYYPNGNLHSKGVFLNGNEHGLWVIYDSISKKINHSVFYKNGIIQNMNE